MRKRVLQWQELVTCDSHAVDWCSRSECTACVVCLFTRPSTASNMVIFVYNKGHMTNWLTNYYYTCMILWYLCLSDTRLRPIPEFTDTTDTDTLDLHRCRYRVPIPIPVVTLQPPWRVVSRYIAWALSRPVMKVLNISISTPITIFWKPFTITIVMSMPILLT